MNTTQGQYWFPKPYADAVARLRVPCGFVLLIAFAWFSKPSVESVGIGLPVALVGLLLRAWATGHLAKNKNLATSGPYAYIRNPLYVGTLIVGVGIVIACRDRILAAIFAVVFLLVYLPVIELEEQHLRKIFPDYGAYAEKVHRLLPLSHWPAQTGQFAWSLYKKNEEYKALAGFLLAVAWIAAKLWWRQTHG